MKFNLRWQLLLAATGFLFIVALLSYQVQSAGLCSVTAPAAGGVYREGMVGAPRYLNPLLSDANPVDRELSQLLFDGLTRYDAEGNLVTNLAESWVVGEEGLSVRFTLRDDAVWHDGQPVTAEDVAFTYGLMQSEAFPGPAALHNLWRTVTIEVLDPLTIEFSLMEPYTPFLEATTRGILPAHRLEGVTAATLAEATFNRTPVGTGPFMVSEDSDWTRTGRLQLLPDPMVWREGTQIPVLSFRFFPNEAAMLAAFEAGELHAINSVTPSLLPAAVTQPEMRLFTAPIPRYTMLLFNLRESGATAVRSQAVRQALGYSLDRERLLDTAVNGQGIPFDGPYLPRSWAYEPGMTAYTYQPETAVALLDGEGWGWPAGEPVRRREDEPLTLRLLALTEQRALAEATAAQWAAQGIGAELVLVDSAAARQAALAEGAFDVALVDILPPGDPDLYDFWSQEAIVRGQNYGGWNNRRASEALEAARQIWPVAERRPYYETFLQHYENDVPALTLYQHVSTYGLSRDVNEAQVGRIDSPRDRYETFAGWFLEYREVLVSCTEEETS